MISRKIHDFFHSLVKICRSGDTRFTEVLISFIVLSWAVCMCLPDWPNPQNQLYVSMAQLLPQWTWTVCLFVLGSFQLLSTVSNNLRNRRHSIFMVAGFFCFALTAFLRAKVLFPGSFIVPVYLFFSLNIYWKLSAQLRYEERLKIKSGARTARKGALKHGSLEAERR